MFKLPRRLEARTQFQRFHGLTLANSVELESACNSLFDRISGREPISIRLKMLS
jgi:hypothetical protein